MGSEILVIDDESDIRELVSGILEDEGYRTRVAEDSSSALREISLRCPGLVLLDVWLEGSELDGLELLAVIKEKHPDLPVVMISGHGNIETAVSAIKRGAYDFVEKPFKADRLLLVTSRAIENSRLQREVTELRERSGAFGHMVGNSQPMLRLRAALEKVAKTNARVLITGFPGSGKEVAARILHELSLRHEAPFVVLNAATMSPEKMEVELFGIEATANGQQYVGLLESAHGGTLFIDEIADMPLETQTKILKVLLDQTFCRVGGSTPVQVDVRIISSSSRDLELEIAEGRLRSELFHRLNVVSVHVPSLSERRDDVPELVDYFMHQISRAEGLPTLNIGEDVMAVLQSYSWPGNVRQLRNAVERLMILANENSGKDVDVVTVEEEIDGSLPPSPISLGANQLISMPLRAAREAFEREYLLAQIARFGGNISRTAEFVGMERSALHRKLRLLGIVHQRSSSVLPEE